MRFKAISFLPFQDEMDKFSRRWEACVLCVSNTTEDGQGGGEGLLPDMDTMAVLNRLADLAVSPPTVWRS
jgi:hypothetical protein